MKYNATVTRVVKEAPHISTIYFTISGGVFPYVAGQYISVYFEQTVKKSGKAYSLSSAPRDPELSITVKNIGEFSGLICALKPGELIQISSPFGFFNSNDDLPIVAIIAGVGVSPIWSIIRNELDKNMNRTIGLYHTAAREDGLVFRSKVSELFAVCPNAKTHYYVTRELSLHTEHRRFSQEADLSKEICDASRFYVCGAESFVQSIWQQLMEAGVNEQRIVTEIFFESNV